MMREFWIEAAVSIVTIAGTTCIKRLAQQAIQKEKR